MASEKLTSRVSRIVTGGLHALVDVMEEAAPEAIMEQAIREIDEASSEVQVELSREVAQKQLIIKRLLEENHKHDELSEKIQLALQQGREDLAKAAVSRQLDIEAQVPVFENNIATHTEREKELEGFVIALQAKKREMKDELVEFRSVRKIETGMKEDVLNRGASTPQHRVDRAESAFERVLEKATGSVKGGKAKDEVSQQIEELEKLSRENRVNERLAQLKTKLGE